MTRTNIMDKKDINEKTVTLNSYELEFTSKAYSVIGRRFLNKYNVDRFYRHILGKTEVKAFSERLIAKVSPVLKIYDVRFEETKDKLDNDVQTCTIIIINTETCRRISYFIKFTICCERMSWKMGTFIIPEDVDLDDLIDDAEDNNEDNNSAKAS